MPTTNVIFVALTAFGITISSALRGALTAKVPPKQLAISAQYRPLAASLVSALLTFLLTVQAGQDVAHAGAAAIVVLGASLAKLIAAEGDAAGAASTAPATPQGTHAPPAEATKPPTGGAS